MAENAKKPQVPIEDRLRSIYKHLIIFNIISVLSFVIFRCVAQDYSPVFIPVSYIFLWTITRFPGKVLNKRDKIISIILNTLMSLYSVISCIIVVQPHISDATIDTLLVVLTVFSFTQDIWYSFKCTDLQKAYRISVSNDDDVVISTDQVKIDIDIFKAYHYAKRVRIMFSIGIIIQFFTLGFGLYAAIHGNYNKRVWVNVSTISSK